MHSPCCHLSANMHPLCLSNLEITQVVSFLVLSRLLKVVKGCCRWHYHISPSSLLVSLLTTQWSQWERQVAMVIAVKVHNNRLCDELATITTIKTRRSIIFYENQTLKSITLIPTFCYLEDLKHQSQESLLGKTKGETITMIPTLFCYLQYLKNQRVKPSGPWYQCCFALNISQ